jgi:stress-induced morphogen
MPMVAAQAYRSRRVFFKLVWSLHGSRDRPLECIAMAMDGTEIERLIKQAFPDAQVVVVDLRGDGDHYGARVTSRVFQGKSRIQQHKMVYDALQGQMGGALHALALETLVPK